MERLLEDVKKIAGLMEKSRYTVVLSGAGISTEGSGPDFQNPDSALWKMVAPSDFTIHRFENDPEAFYEAGAPYFDLLEEAEPNEVHIVLAELEKRGLVKMVITQNIDGLHQRAGSENVLEIHGTLRSASCVQCDYGVLLKDVLPETGKSTQPPQCPKCGEILKPDVVFSGEPPPPDFERAKEAVKRAELLIIVGSNMQTPPVDQLPVGGGDLVIINHVPTGYDGQARVVVNESAARVMRLLLEELDKRK